MQQSKESHPLHPEEEYDVDKLIDKMRALKARLMDAGIPLNLACEMLIAFINRNSLSKSFIYLALLELDVRGSHETCQLEVQQLRQELDWYKQEEHRWTTTNRNASAKVPVAGASAAAEEELNQLAAEMERGQERKGSQTVGARFRDQLRDLIQRLDA